MDKVSVWRALYRRITGWGVYLATSLIVNAFLLFEATADLRIYGLERLRQVKQEEHNPLLVIWHGQGLLPMAAFRNERLCLYASHARDPNYTRGLQILRWWTLRFIERMGYRVLDASEFKSESRGVLQFVEILRSGTGSMIAADGPLGPIYKAKAGPTFLAKKTGVALVPLGAAVSSGFHLENWDRFEVPWPFAEAVLVVGEPIFVPARANETELETFRLALETEMNRLQAEAQQRLQTEGGSVGFPSPPLYPVEQRQGESAQG
ncbi:MAG TPA: hypothetical protein VKU00_06270 [Chthonomonadaceae bacterium]|nr:hypothetical protein [Chthonomonadaceae bacterium]